MVASRSAIWRPRLQPWHGPDLLVYGRPGACVRNVIVNGQAGGM
ncbi:hypothetical protein [Desulfobulbus sp.]|nr:hypothetical protein [Desulfobulbus sp.]